MVELQPARYLILLMSLFSIYSGLIYNDFLSYSLDLFGSCHQDTHCTYPFGVDPVWAYSSNDIAFSNSHKMKQAVIIGVLQMTMGLCLKGLNNIYFRDGLELVAETIPQLVFMLSAFGFMVYLIVYKWLSGSDFSIITMLINNPLSYIMGGSSVLSPLEHTQL